MCVCVCVLYIYTDIYIYTYIHTYTDIYSNPVDSRVLGRRQEGTPSAAEGRGAQWSRGWDACGQAERGVERAVRYVICVSPVPTGWVSRSDCRPSPRVVSPCKRETQPVGTGDTQITDLTERRHQSSAPAGRLGPGADQAETQKARSAFLPPACRGRVRGRAWSCVPVRCPVAPCGSVLGRGRGWGSC